MTAGAVFMIFTITVGVVCAISTVAVSLRSIKKDRVASTCKFYTLQDDTISSESYKAFMQRGAELIKQEGFKLNDIDMWNYRNIA